MVAGSALLAWHVGAVWAWGLLSVSIILLLTVLASPTVAQGTARFFARVESGLARTVTWLLLGLVFVCLFVPGRLLLWLTGDSRFGRKPRATYWRRRDDRPETNRFEVPY